MTRFDGTAIWNSLSAEAMEQIGSIALELVAAWHCRQRSYEDGALFGDRNAALLRAADASGPLLLDLLRQAFVEHVDETRLNDESGFPLLPAMLGPVCRGCGCSQLDACQPFSCAWVEPDLCSACAASPEPVTPNL